jgi:N-acetylmuramoyl-L-alanine amidase
LRKHHQVWKTFFESLQKRSVDARTSMRWRRSRIFQKYSAGSFVGKLSVVAMLGVLFVCITLGLNVGSAHAQSQTVCSSGDRTYVVVSGDTLSGIAYRFGTNWGNLASHNHIANPSLIYANQVICIPSAKTVNSVVHASTSKTNVPLNNISAPRNTAATAVSASSPVGSVNVFPYGPCTWWANQRYFRLHGVFVPWRTQSDAWEWTARAYQFGWHVSSSPTVGSIIVLQPWVQGAYGLGHVGVVEQVLSNGHVIASNMSWGAYPWQVTYVQFTPGPGVTFISR